MKSEVTKALDKLLSKFKPRLKELGFRSRGRTFNRTTADGLTQVVNFQMGAFDPPGTTYIPGLRENMYGKFTVNLGIYVPEVEKHYNEARSFVQEHYCCVRARLGNLGRERNDLWWDLRQADKIAAEVWERLEKEALSFLGRFESRDAILREWRNRTENFCASHPPRIDRDHSC